MEPFLPCPSRPIHRTSLALCFPLLFIYAFILSHNPFPDPSGLSATPLLTNLSLLTPIPHHFLLTFGVVPQQTAPDVLGLAAGTGSDHTGRDASFEGGWKRADYQKTHNPFQASKQIEKVWRIDREGANSSGRSLHLGKGGESYEKRLKNLVDAILLSNNTFHPKHLPERCDLTLGRWVRDSSEPLYPPGSCPYVDEGFRCQENGRLDTDYMRWRWKPTGCEIPRVNATELLERLRGKRLIFVGDSLNRNQWESMVCILRAAVEDKGRISDNYLERAKQGAVKFLDYDARVEFYGSSFLVDEWNKGGAEGGRLKRTLRLDKVDRSEKRWRKGQILVFNTGHWWTRGKTAKGIDFFQEGEAVYQKLKLRVAFKKAMTTWAAWVDKYTDLATTQVFFRAYSPSHFKSGNWNSGGRCDRDRQPIFNESFTASYPEKMRVVEEIVKHMNTPVIILNVTRLSGYRKDAHPSVYGQARSVSDRKAGSGYQDCSPVWLPGLPDTWNELLYYYLVMS